MSHFEEMRVFVAVIETGSISRAADRLGIAVSAVSRRLSQLESRLNATLIQRTTRRMSVTETGHRFYDQALDILERVEHAEQEATSDTAAVTGTLRIAAPVTFSITHLASDLAEFSRLHPNLRLEIDVNDRRVDLVQDGVDVAIRIGKLEDSTLIARRLSSVEHVVCASPSLLDRYSDIKMPEDLAGKPGVCYANIESPNRWFYTAENGRRRSVEVDARWLASNGDVIREAAIGGVGFICEPAFVVSNALDHGSLKRVLPEWKWFGLDIFAVFPRSAALPKRTRVFVDFIAMRYEDRVWL